MKHVSHPLSRLFSFPSALLIVVYTLCGCQGGSQSAVPDLVAKQYKGATVDLQKAAKGKITVVNIWSTFCGPCLQELPDLHKLYDTYKNNSRVAFISIALNNEEELDQFNNQPDSSNPYKQAFQASRLDSFYLPTLPILKGGNKVSTMNGQWAIKPADTAELNGIMRRLNITGVPTIFVYNEDGSLAKKVEGMRTEDYWVQVIDGLLANH
jgi:thiol-disulfide isomerase/thioredoxin